MPAWGANRKACTYRWANSNIPAFHGSSKGLGLASKCSSSALVMPFWIADNRLSAMRACSNSNYV